MKLGILSEKYEGSGPGSISSGEGDSGGVSYGTYQMATATGTVAEFVKWLLGRWGNGREAGEMLALSEPGSAEFSERWTYLASLDSDWFGSLQEEFVVPRYYDAALEVAWERGINVEALPYALKCVLFSNAVQHGPQNAGELLADSYDDDLAAWIGKIYDTKIADPDWSSGAPDLRPGLFNRWQNEKQDAIALLRGEGI